MLIQSGDQFGRLTVIGPGKRRYHMLCRCRCGIEKEVATGNLRGGRSTSCGCLRAERNNHTIHSGTGTLTFKRWRSMRKRCNDPNAVGFARYGGKGITVCDRWKDFKNFRADMGECPGSHMTVDRRDNSLGYSPSNCRWETKTQQARNTSSNRLIKFNGETRCVAEWAEVLGVNPRTITTRLNNGWDEVSALSAPVRAHKRYAPRA